MMVESGERTVLWAAIEDYAGLWEIVWELRSLAGGLLDTATAVRTARDIVSEFLRNDFVQAYYCQEPYGELTVIPRDQAIAVLMRDDSWAPPVVADSVTVRIGATDAGEAHYRD